MISDLNWARNRKVGQPPYLGSGPSAGVGSGCVKKPAGRALSKSGHFAAKRTDDPVEAASLQWALRLAGPCNAHGDLGPLVDAHEKRRGLYLGPKYVHQAIRFHGPGRPPLVTVLVT